MFVFICSKILCNQLLGRAKDAADFIKHGKDRAFIEIELKGPANGRNVVIRRDMKREGATDWRINGILREWCE